jgi:hypothetical protein
VSVAAPAGKIGSRPPLWRSALGNHRKISTSFLQAPLADWGRQIEDTD